MNRCSFGVYTPLTTTSPHHQDELYARRPNSPAGVPCPVTQQHHVHHALVRNQSDSNYGCSIILWDRLFGTYCGDTEVGQIGAGKAVSLFIKEQLMLALYPNKRLTDL
jgi:sterol desaturase/sphingolipid hydroxylase (fatty acid hydroxylase superfamily)